MDTDNSLADLALRIQEIIVILEKVRGGRVSAVGMSTAYGCRMMLDAISKPISEDNISEVLQLTEKFIREMEKFLPGGELNCML